MVKNVAVISLSSGTIGENFASHEVKLGIERLENFGLNVKFTKHARMGREYIKNHPEKRASDLLEALADDEVDMILCAIGGDDTYRLLPYLFDNGELQHAVIKGKNKIFLGFSDTTANHFMLGQVGMKTFYGQSFLADVCELAPTMLSYSEKYFKELLTTGQIRRITPSDEWFYERTDWSEEALGTNRIARKNHGFELLQGNSRFSGEIYGGCIDTIYDFFDNGRYADSSLLCRKYKLFPDTDFWCGKILLLETSEVKATPELYGKMLDKLADLGIFDVISGIICGKPCDDLYHDEYNRIICDAVGRKDLPIVSNINVGHATPRCIIPLGVSATVDTDRQEIIFDWEGVWN